MKKVGGLERAILWQVGQSDTAEWPRWYHSDLHLLGDSDLIFLCLLFPLAPREEPDSLASCVR